MASTPKLHLTRRRRILLAGIPTVLAAAGIGLIRVRGRVPATPTAVVSRGEFVDYVQIRGEVKPVKSVQLTAPFISEDLQIVKLARTGAMVKRGDVIVQFDASKLRQTLDEKRSEVKQAEAEIEQVRAQGRLQEEQDRTELMKARYDVDRARLEVSKQEILSQIEGEKTKLALADAGEKLRETEVKDSSDKTSAAADLRGKNQKREKSRKDLEQAEHDIAQLTLRAPADGMVTLGANFRAGGFFGLNTPEFRQGDRVWPGAIIAEIPDLSTIRVTCRVDEIDRGRLRMGQRATVRVDALPDRELSGSIAEISPLARIEFTSWPPAKQFDVAVQLEQTDPRLRPGMSATLRVAAERVPDSILIPAEAVFSINGEDTAFVLKGSRFEQRTITAARKSGGRVLVASGVTPGERVALRRPEEEKTEK